MESINSILKQYWGYSSFRPLQEDIINAVLRQEDCLALLPTGGGKSLCFQVPAMAMNGLCLVVTPLIALMKDQVENLRRKGITAFSLYAGMSLKEVIQTLTVAANSNCKFLYVSPERLESNLFKEFLPSLGVSLIAVDEAHCISQWGYDFRPAYLKIALLREELSSVPVLALTASATEEVQYDICDRLMFARKNIFRQSFERPNLSYSVFEVSSKINKITELLEKQNGTAIVYCRSRKKTKDISDLLNMKGIPSDYYHAGLTQEERNLKQDGWLKNNIRVIVCTNAFGMGIDKPDVRVVIHADVTECLENYYQEAGRAGRDRNEAHAYLLAAPDEIKQIEESALSKFPPEGVIREIYKSIMNHLQVPSGTGEGNYYEFDATRFIKDFKLHAPTVFSVLKTLEQEELLYFSEQVYTQPKIHVLASRDRMTEFEKEAPALDSLLKTILRSYEGVIDQPTNINERMLALSAKKAEDEIKTQLQELHRLRIIDYIPRKDKPQVYFFRNRVKSEDLMIDMRRYNDRKKRFEKRLKAMSEYVNNRKQCRSVMIGKYFGDKAIKDCGICDNCTTNNNARGNPGTFQHISRQVYAQLTVQPLAASQLAASVRNASESDIKKVIAFLIDEEKILMTDTGVIVLKNASFPASPTKS